VDITGEQVRSERRGGLLSRFRPGEPEAPREGIEGLLRTVKSYNAKADLKEIERAYLLRRDAPRGAEAALGRGLHQPPALGDADPRRSGARHDDARRRAPARHVEDTDVTLGSSRRASAPRSHASWMV